MKKSGFSLFDILGPDYLHNHSSGTKLHCWRKHDPKY